MRATTNETKLPEGRAVPTPRDAFQPSLRPRTPRGDWWRERRPGVWLTGAVSKAHPNIRDVTWDAAQGRGLRWKERGIYNSSLNKGSRPSLQQGEWSTDAHCRLNYPTTVFRAEQAGELERNGVVPAGAPGEACACPPGLSGF